jgi:hypothetical protein
VSYFINNSVYDNGSTYNFSLDQPKHLAKKQTKKQTNFCPLLSLPRAYLTDWGQSGANLAKERGWGSSPFLAK